MKSAIGGICKNLPTHTHTHARRRTRYLSYLKDADADAVEDGGGQFYGPFTPRLPDETAANVDLESASCELSCFFKGETVEGLQTVIRNRTRTIRNRRRLSRLLRLTRSIKVGELFAEKKATKCSKNK